MRLTKTTLTLLLIACAALAPTATHAAHPRQLTSPVTMVIDGGFNSFAKGSAWVPLHITLENTGDAIEGELVLINEKSNELLERFSLPVSLASGRRREATLYVPASSSTFEVKFIVAEQAIAAATPVLRQLADTDRLIVVVSDPADAFNFLGDLRVPYGGRSVIAPTTPQRIPDRTTALDSVDVIVFNNVDTTMLSTAQRNAIQAWVTAGGYLVFNGGPGAALALAGFRDVAPATPSQTLIGGSALAFRQFIAPSVLGARPNDLALNVPSVRLTLNEGAHTVIGSPETPLVARIDAGSGRIDQLAFDATLAPMRDWVGRTALFGALLGGRVDLPLSVSALREDGAPVQAVGALPAARLPSVLLVGGFLLLYVLVIGPLNYLLLRRLKKLAWAWFTIPATVVAFTLAGVLTGFRLRGNAPQMHRLNLVIGDAGMAHGRTFALLGLFAPRRIETTLSLGRDLAEQVTSGSGGGSGGPRSLLSEAVFRVGEPSMFANLNIGGSDVRGIYTRGETELPKIEADLKFISGTDRTYGKLQGTVRNNAGITLKDCTLFAGKDYQVIGSMNAGDALNAKVLMYLGRSQPAMNLRNARLGRDRYYRGPYYYRSYRTSQSSAPPGSTGSSSSSSTPPPFDLLGDPVTNGLVNWKEFNRNELTQEAQHGLVFSVLGDDRIGIGARLACWTDSNTSSAQVAGAEYTDRTLVIWRVPVQSALATENTLLSPDVFAWDVFASTSSASFTDQGLALDTGEHLIDVSPWFNVRPTSNAITLTLESEFGGTLPSALKDTTLSIFDWRAGEFVLLGDANALTGKDVFVGNYLSSAGQLRFKFVVAGDTITLSNIAPEAQVRGGEE